MKGDEMRWNAVWAEQKEKEEQKRRRNVEMVEGGKPLA